MCLFSLLIDNSTSSGVKTFTANTVMVCQPICPEAFILVARNIKRSENRAVGGIARRVGTLKTTTYQVDAYQRKTKKKAKTNV